MFDRLPLCRRQRRGERCGSELVLLASDGTACLRRKPSCGHTRLEIPIEHLQQNHAEQSNCEQPCGT